MKQSSSTDSLFSVAFTKWHALGVELAVDELSSADSGFSGTVIMRKHDIAGTLISEEDFSLVRYSSVNVQYYENNRGYWNKVRLMFCLAFIWLLPLRSLLSKPKKPVHIVSPLFSPWLLAFEHLGFIYLLRRGVMPHRIDEGFASYIPEDLWKKKRARESGKEEKRFKLRKSSCFDDFQAKLFTLIDSLLRYENRCLFELDEESESLKPRDAFVRKYAKAISKKSIRPGEKGCLKSIQTKFGAIALLITQPWSESGEVEAQKESQLLLRAIRELNSKGYHVVIKPHPREDTEKFYLLLQEYNDLRVEILAEKIAVEQIYSMLEKDDIVAGFFSTALLNANLFYGVPAYVAHEGWFSEVGVPDDIYLSQQLFRKYTRLLLNDFKNL